MPNFSRLSRTSSVSQTQQVPQVLQQFQPQPQMQPQTQSRPQSSQEPQGIHNRYLRGAIGNVYAVRPLEVPDIGNNQTAAQQIQQLDGQQHPVQPLRFMDVPEDWARSAGLTELLMRGVDLDAV